VKRPQKKSNLDLKWFIWAPGSFWMNIQGSYYNPVHKKNQINKIDKNSINKKWKFLFEKWWPTLSSLNDKISKWSRESEFNSREVWCWESENPESWFWVNFESKRCGWGQNLISSNSNRRCETNQRQVHTQMITHQSALPTNQP